LAASGPDPCAVTDTPKGPRGAKADGSCDPPSKPTPAPKVVPGGGAVVAAEDPEPAGKPKRLRHPKDPEVAVDDGSESPEPPPTSAPKPDRPADPVLVVAPAPDVDPKGKPETPARPDDGPKPRVQDEAPKVPPPPKPAPAPKAGPGRGKPGR
jgi:hypothetical protein